MAAIQIKRWFRFSLATLLVVFTALSIWLGWQSYLARRQKAAIDVIVAAEGIAIFDDDSRISDTQPANASSSPVTRMRKSIGEDFFREVKIVDFATNNGRRRDTKKPKVTDDSLAHLSGLTDLETLELGHNETVNDEALRHLSGLRNLKTLYLYHTPVRGTGLLHLVGLPKLASLSMSRASLTDEGLEHIGKMSRLKWLRLDHTHITDAGIAHLAGLNNLEDLSLAYTDVTDACLVELEALTGLKSLGLMQSNITAAGAERIRQALPNCEMWMTFGFGKTPRNLELIPDDRPLSESELNARFKTLGIDGHVRSDSSQPGSPITTLYLGEVTLSDRVGLRLMARLPMLKQLAIRGALFGDEFLKGLVGLKHLDYLELSDTRVSESGLEPLSQITSLSELGLSNNRFTDSVVPTLSRLTSLKRLGVEDTRISDEGIKRLEQALPNCMIY